MAYSVIHAESRRDDESYSGGYYYEYLCESVDDIADLPTGADGNEIGRPRPGSLAYIESDPGARYILKNNREWGEYPMASGGSGGGESAGGYDAVFKVTYNFDKSAYEAEVVSGSYEAVLAKIQNEEPLRFGAVFCDYYEDGADNSNLANYCSMDCIGVTWNAYEMPSGTDIFSYFAFPVAANASYDLLEFKDMPLLYSIWNRSGITIGINSPK